MNIICFKISIFFAFISGLCNTIIAADTLDFSKADTLPLIINNGDTIYVSDIDEIIIRNTSTSYSYRDNRRYERLVRNVKKVYPYAKMAGAKYKEVSAHMSTLKTEREKKVYLKQVEKEIVGQYEDELKQLTITQGRILLKLIDREIGETSYDLLKDLKGSFSAIFWQTLARIFGHNLKSEFDPTGEDKQLNEILLQIDAGNI
jgi:hypothetical protein